MTILRCEDCGSDDSVSDDYRYPVGDNETHAYCPESAEKAGFCLGCHYFQAGFESFDFSPIKGYCYDCIQELDLEDDDRDYEYDDDWEAD